MSRILPLPLLLTMLACPGPEKEVGAISEGGGSGSSDESGPGSLSASSTSAATSATTIATSSSDSGDSSGSTSAPGTESGSGVIDCDCLPEQICTPDGCFGGQVFLHFDGPTMVNGTDDASLDQTSIAELTGAMLAYGGDDEARAALLAAVRERVALVSLWVTDERPTSGDYSMIVLGNNLAGFGGALEIGPLNCGHANPRTVGFSGIHAADGLDVGDKAGVIAHGIGHGAGLDHVDDTAAIMGPFASGDATFGAGCLALTAGGGCTAEHLAFCGDGEQDSLAELQAIYGAP